MRINVKNKQVTTYLILSILIALNIISTTINPDFALATPPIIPKPFATLDLINVIRANCHLDTTDIIHLCPSVFNTPMKTYIPFGGHTYQFPVGVCGGEKEAVHAHFTIPIGYEYKITGNNTQHFQGPFEYEYANIEGGPEHGRGGCTGTNSCVAVMHKEGAYVSELPLEMCRGLLSESTF